MLSSEVSVTTGRMIEVSHSSSKNDRSEVHRWGVGRVECGESIEVVALIESEDMSADPEAEGSLGAEFGEEAEESQIFQSGSVKMENGFTELKSI